MQKFESVPSTSHIDWILDLIQYEDLHLLHFAAILMVGMPSEDEKEHGWRLIIALLGNPIWMHSREIQSLVLHLVQHSDISLVQTPNSEKQAAIAALFNSLSAEGNLRHISADFRSIWMTLAEKSDLSAIEGEGVNADAVIEMVCFGRIPSEHVTRYLITRDLSILQLALDEQMYHSFSFVVLGIF
jgi:hypothetical protein